MNVLNARIYEKILGNFEEYISNKDILDNELRYLVLTTINFNLNHAVFKFYDYKTVEGVVFPSNFLDLDCSINFLNVLDNLTRQLATTLNTKIELLDFIKSGIFSRYRDDSKRNSKKEDKNILTLPTSKLDKDIEQVDKYANLIWFFWLLEVKLKYRKNISEEKQKEINNFIETGIL